MAAEPDLSSFDSVLAYWKAKKAVGYSVFEKMAAEAKAKSFSTALDYSESTLQALADSLDEAIKAGKTVWEWKQTFREVLDKFGYDPEIPAYRLNLLYRQNIINALNLGRYADMFSDAAQIVHPAWRFLAIHDRRVDDPCLALDGRVFYKNDLVGRRFLPPIHFQCRCTAQSVTAQELKEEPGILSAGQDVLDKGIRPDEGFDFDKARSIRDILKGADPTKFFLPGIPAFPKLVLPEVPLVPPEVLEPGWAEWEEAKKALALKKAEKAAATAATKATKLELLQEAKTAGLPLVEAEALAKKLAPLVTKEKMTIFQANAAIKEAALKAEKTAAEAAKLAKAQAVGEKYGLAVDVADPIVDTFEKGLEAYAEKWGKTVEELQALAKTVALEAKPESLFGLLTDVAKALEKEAAAKAQAELEKAALAKAAKPKLPKGTKLEKPLGPIQASKAVKEAWAEGYFEKHPDFIGQKNPGSLLLKSTYKTLGDLAQKMSAAGATKAEIQAAFKALASDATMTKPILAMKKTAYILHDLNAPALTPQKFLELVKAVDAQGPLKNAYLSPDDLAFVKKFLGADEGIVPFAPVVETASKTKSAEEILAYLNAEEKAAALKGPLSTDGWKLVDAHPNLPGAFEKQIWQDASGEKWLFKPLMAGDTGVKIAADEVAGKLGKIIVPEGSVEARVVTLGDRLGSVQRLVPNAKPLPGLAELTDAQIAQIQQQQVLDWLISNHDAHVDQFILDAQGNVVGVDKAQAFKFWGKDSLSPTYHPNTIEKPPIYNLLAQGKAGVLDPYAIRPALERALAIPDAELRAILEPYAKVRFGGDTAAAEKFVAQVVNRKNTLREAFGGYYSTITKKTIVFEPAAAVVPKAAQGLEAKAWVKAEAEKVGLPWSDSYAEPKVFEKYYPEGYKGKVGYKALGADDQSHFYPGVPPPSLGAPTLEAWKADQALQAASKAAADKAAQELAKAKAAEEAKQAAAKAAKYAGTSRENYATAINEWKAQTAQDLGSLTPEGMKKLIGIGDEIDQKLFRWLQYSDQAEQALIVPGTLGRNHVIAGGVEGLLKKEMMANGLSAERARAAISVAERYTGSYYGVLNRYLRKGELGGYEKATLDRDIASLRDLMNYTVPYREDVPLWRGTHLSDATLEKLSKEKVWKDGGFSSASTDPDKFRSWGDNLSICYLPSKGRRSAVSIQGLSGHTSEHEVLFNAGTKFDILTFRRLTAAEKSALGTNHEWLLVVREIAP